MATLDNWQNQLGREQNISNWDKVVSPSAESVTNSPMQAWWDKDQYGDFSFENTSSIQDAQALRLANLTRSNLTYLANAPLPALASIMQRYRAALQGIRSDTMISALAMTQRTAQLKKQALDAVDAVNGNIQKAVAGVRDSLLNSRNTAAGAPPIDQVAELLALTKRNDGWRRACNLLDNSYDMRSLITFAATSNDVDMLAAIRHELPSWLVIRVDQHEYKRALEGYMEMLDQVETPLLAAYEQAKRKITDLVNTGAANLNGAVSCVQDFIKTGHDYQALVGFMPGQYAPTAPQANPDPRPAGQTDATRPNAGW